MVVLDLRRVEPRRAFLAHGNPGEKFESGRCVAAASGGEGKKMESFAEKEEGGSLSHPSEMIVCVARF